MYEGQRALCSEIHIGFVNYHYRVLIVLYDISDEVKALAYACGSVRICDHYSPVRCIIILSLYHEIIIQLLRLVRDAVDIRPHIVEGISDIREEYRLITGKEGQETHGEDIIRAHARKDL